MPLRPNLYNLLTEYLMVRKKQDASYFIARTMLEYLDSLPTMKIEVLARYAGTTPATVTKFCRSLGFCGYTDLREPDAGTELIVPGNLKLGHTHAETVNLWIETKNNLMHAFAQSFDAPHVRSVAQRIARSSRLVILTGIYGYAAIDLFLEQIKDTGISAIPVNRGAEARLIEAEACSADLVLVVSLTGEWYRAHARLVGLTAENAVLISQTPVDGVDVIRLDAVPGDFFASMQITQTALTMLFTTIAAMVYEELG